MSRYIHLPTHAASLWGADADGNQQPIYSSGNALRVTPYYWNPNTLAYEVATVAQGAGGDVNVTNPSLAVTGPLTDTQLRATAIPVSGTFFQATQPVSGPLTDTQLRASAVPVSGSVTTGGLTDTQLRASAVPTSLASLPNPSNLDVAASTLAKDSSLTTLNAKDFATQATLALIKAKTDNLPVDPAREGGVLATAANQTSGNASLTTIAAKDFATQTTLAALLAAAGIAPGAVSTSQSGPMVQGVVSDTAQSYFDSRVEPLSLTTDGRLRVSSAVAAEYLDFFGTDLDLTDLSNPWAMNSLWE